MEDDDPDACGVWSTAVFLVGLIAGTTCTVLSKMLFQTEAIGLSGELEPFRPSLFQTWIMFLSMSFALPIHLMSEARRRRSARGKAAELHQITQEQARLRNLRQFLPLTVPAIFDLISTLLMILGLMYINASVWMLLRGAGVVFVALMKNFFLYDALRPNMWVGVFTIACGVVLVGLSSRVGHSLSDGREAAYQSTTGVMLTLLGTFVQSLQYTYEEKVLSLDIAAPPWMLIGLEGAFCTILSTCVLYPLFCLLPGDDHGSFESPYNTVTQLRNSRLLVILAVSYGVTVFVLNAFSVLVTYMMSTFWHAVLDNIRPVAIWAAQLTLYYGVTGGKYGEEWTLGSWLELVGMLVTLFGTAVYNGSISLPGLEGILLIGSSSPMSTPALARSPLISRHPELDITTGSRSPYAMRRGIDDEEAMGYGGSTSLNVGLVAGGRS